MRQTNYIFLFLIFFVSCSPLSVKEPKNLISQEKMTEVLTDIYLHLQPAYSNQVLENSLNYAEIDAQIIAKHGLDIDTFKESFRYYVLTPELYSAILVDVRSNLESRLPEEERKMKEEEREAKDVKK
ncbi:MAG: DUF4296 domain-containing protein [Weeksellaceae bacterium]|jgi:hypothetical protein|nr:DUF4296 domain-containing protein [Weeksellaceae bacterium]MDX9705897.1 DUF4296 domain-containing protein [Weeksellaceae bacterium]